MAHILLIDDDASVLLVVAETLRVAGHTVDEVSDGRRGLALYQAERHDLIITDIVMPDMEGLELINLLRRAAPRPRIIAMSGGTIASESLYLPLAKRFGALRTLAKPFTPASLKQAVDEVLASA